MLHRQPLRRCEVKLVPTSELVGDHNVDDMFHDEGPFMLVVRFLDVTERAVCPGQVLALYSGDECLGGGLIKQAAPRIMMT